MKTFGVGIVGFGFIGKVHAHAHRSLPLFYDPLPARTELIGVCASSEETTQKAVVQGGFKIGFTDYRDLLEREDIDLIHICTPNDSHKEIVEAALKAEKHIYCDKPLALNCGEAEEIVQLAPQSNQVHQMTFNYRFVPAIMRARELVEAGYLGDLFSFRVAYLHAGYISPARPYSWRTNFAKSGGGAISDLGAHVIDLLRFLTGPGSNVARGGETVALNATLQTLIQERADPKTGELRRVDVDDVAFATLRLEGGAVGTLEASRLATGVQDELRIELHGSKGSLKFNLMEADWLDAYDASLPESPLGGDRGHRRIEAVTRYPKPYSLGATKNTVGWMNFHIASVFDFVNNVSNVEEGKLASRLSPTFQDGLAVQKIISACQTSSQNAGAWTPV